MSLKEKQQSVTASAEFDLKAEFRNRAELSGHLLSNIKRQLPKLEEFLARVEGHWGMEDGFYRFYHQSFKVYHIQQMTLEIRNVLQNLLPERPMNSWFCKIVANGTENSFDLSHNENWLDHTRPMLEAFFHSHYFLKMAVKYGRELSSAPDVLPSGWAAVLYLFNLR